MASNFIKRKQKEQGTNVEQKATPAMTHTALDVVVDEVNKTYRAYVIRYNPDTGLAEVTQIKDLSRLVALSFNERKKALKTIIKLKE